MSYSLPKATKTQKLSSLGGDLRKYAEELIAKKFDIPEVMERPASSPSTDTIEARDYRRTDTVRPPSYADERYAGYKRDVAQGFRRETWSDYTVTFDCTAESHIISAIREMDYHGIRSQNRRIMVGKAGFAGLRRIRDLIVYDVQRSRPDMIAIEIGNIFGVPIYYDYHMDKDAYPSGRLEGQM